MNNFINENNLNFKLSQNIINLKGYFFPRYWKFGVNKVRADYRETNNNY